MRPSHSANQIKVVQSVTAFKTKYVLVICLLFASQALGDRIVRTETVKYDDDDYVSSRATLKFVRRLHRSSTEVVLVEQLTLALE